MNRVDDRTVIFGGVVQSNDANITDEAAFFAVRDNGEPGKGRDQITPLAFFDGDPSTTGSPSSCNGTTIASLEVESGAPLFTIESGNVQVN